MKVGISGEGGQGLEELHQDLIKAFTRILGLVENAELLGVQGDLKDSRFRQDLKAHLDSVRDLQLLMPIVAPMKAGKSTLINAIVGYQLLPARANPMTTLPTKIFLVEGMDLDRPELRIPETTRKLYAGLEDAVGDKLRQGWEVPRQHSYLDDLARSLQHGTVPRLASEYVGRDEVHRILARLNDEMRLGTLAADEQDFLGALTDLPELRTGHSHSFSAGQAKGGQLVIIDTPGPNEHAIAARLGPAVEKQLADSHIVLVVLDYTQMGGDAAADIESRLSRHLKVIGPERLYAVVNKVDARKSRDDLSVADTREAVQHSLGLTEEQAGSQLFEAVAHWGLMGSRLLAEIRSQGDDFQPERSEAARAVLRELHPLDDEEDLAERLARVSLEELTRDGERFQRKSQITTLINAAITRLRRNAAPQVMDAGIRRYEAAIGDIADLVALERSAAERETGVIEEQLATLNAEMELLRTHRDNRPNVEELQRRFQSEIDKFAGQLGAQGNQIIQVLRAKPPRTAEPPSGWEPVKAFRRFMKATVDVLFSGKPATDEYEFHDLAEANKFKDELAGVATEQLRQLMDLGKRQLDTRVDTITAAIVMEQENKVRGLIDRAAKTLSTAFDVKLRPPRAEIGGVFHGKVADPVHRVTEETEEYEETTTKRTWYTLWIGKKDVTVTKQRHVTIHTYVVSRESVVQQLTDAFSAQIEQVRLMLREYVANHLTSEVTAYYDGLSDYLQGYHDALTRSLEIKKKDEAKQAEHHNAFVTLEKNLAGELKLLHDYRLRLE
ncbi:dynamin family protein [Nonomuraea sp. NPDC049649]|uniref:dynamin family protein n=1 Tax=Nonomuraea sp. NPDC049649 TaxID=3155776 RepID=UPI0034237693